MSASPWAGSDLSQKLAHYARQNIDTAFGFAQQLTQAKNVQDVAVRIQTAFFQSQLKSLTEQAKDLSDAAAKAASAALKGIEGGSKAREK